MKVTIGKFNFLLLAVVLLFFVDSDVGNGQIAKGNRTARRVGVMRGNQVRTTFTNWGVIGQPGSQGPNLAWKYDANGYATDVAPIIGLRLPIQIYKTSGFYDGKLDTIYTAVVCNADRSGKGSFSPDGGTFWGFEPIPGFFNPTVVGTGIGIAMSNLPVTWPSQWPDHPDWKDAQGNVQWNGYFGRGQMQADQESYFMMDDQADARMYQNYGFLPDSTDLTRGGMGIRVSVRGLQWANFLAEDVIFWLYDVQNIGTSTYDQAVFGTLVGTYVGVGPSGGDEYLNGASYFDARENITYSWNFNNYIKPSANPFWKPNPYAVGYVGFALLETPGNQYDGIDNDGDDRNFSGNAPYFTEADFNPRTVHAGDKLILIDKQTFIRTPFIMPAYATTVTSMGVQFHLVPDSTVLAEGNLVPGPSGPAVNPNAYDGIDNNLNGLIDENYEVDYRQFKASTAGVTLIDTLNPVQHKDYINNVGLSDPMIDESRDDGIDNNSNWHLLTDDVGLDGQPSTGDFGENDGRPTSGYQKPGVAPGVPNGPVNIYGLEDTQEPGEPDIDKTDPQESDQLGLTSFEYFVPSTDIDLSNQNDLWLRLQPGRFDVPTSVINNRATRGEDGDYIFSSGYFPLPPKDVQRFSLGIVFGDNLASAIRNKNIAQIIYNANYNFPKPPTMPTLKVVPGDHQVTLYWDKVAESSYDQALKRNNFEGYKIYKGTDPDFTDSKTISNAYGQLVDYQPIAQFDLKDGVTGLFQSDPLLYQLSSGKPFYLGDDTGIQNTFVDNDVTNGRTYYYAVTAYDKGDASQSIYPSENTKTIYIDAAGNLVVSQNTAAVVSNAPAAGYVPPPSGLALTRKSGASTATPYVTVVDPTKVKNTTYVLSFLDSLDNGVPTGYAYTLVDSSSNDTIYSKNTRLWPSNGDIFDGLTISLNPHFQLLDSLQLDTAQSHWNNSSTNNLGYSAIQFNNAGITSVRYPRDYMFVFSGTNSDSSSTLTQIFGAATPFQVKTTNFNVFDVTDRAHPVQIQYGYIDRPGAYQDTLSSFDAIYLTSVDGSKLSWRITFIGNSARVPVAGDTLLLVFQKPFTSKDVFIYRSIGTKYDIKVASNSMENIGVVPNPYVISDVFEKPLPAQERGRGQQAVNFINLPPNCTIRIYSSSGVLVRTIYHGSTLQSGSETWNLRTSEGLEVAFGVYFYVVEAQGISDKKFGKLAIIQ
jgi:hypothetical protein